MNLQNELYSLQVNCQYETHVLTSAKAPVTVLPVTETIHETVG